MAEPLKNSYGVEIPKKIAGMIARVYPGFSRRGFLATALDGYEDLELMPRGAQIGRALRAHLPDDYERAVEILLASLGPKLGAPEGGGLAPFLYLPHTCLVAEHGLEHFELSMRALHELTQRFTGEFAIRPFLTHHPEATLARLEEWTRDPSQHVRRLVSEGTRPRLPWAPRLKALQREPRPVLRLLELLKDDPELYVRRSVANNLNDIGKDHPALLVTTARRWLQGASEERRWLVGHALRSAVKRGDLEALAVLGFGGEAKVEVSAARITPRRAPLGGAVEIALTVTNTTRQLQRLLVDLRLHFVKANGRSSPKVFKLKGFELGAGESLELKKKISLAEMTTRKHYPGEHQVEVMLNGTAQSLGSFHLLPA